MFMRVMVFYTVAGGIMSAIAGALGGDLGVSLFAGLMVPPILHIAFIIYRNR